MDTVSLAEAKVRLDALVDRAAAGEAITITHRGREVARLGPVPESRAAIDLAALRALTAGLPPQPGDAASFTRAMRDDERY